MNNVLLDWVSETVKHEIKKQEEKFLDILLGTLGASKLGIILTVKGAVRVGNDVLRAGSECNIDRVDKYF